MSLDNLPVEWLKSSFANLNDYRANNFNPLKNDETYYELYSVPIFPQGYPEILQANEIGSSKQIVEKNDVLLCKINPRINRVWQVSKYTDYLNIASSEWIVFRQCNVVPNFYRYYFQSLEFRNLLCANVSGVGGSLTRAQPKHVATYDLPVPPLAEQQEIVRQLDVMLAQVEQIKARLDAIPAILKKFRQSVLADAVSGKLTEAWRKSRNIEFPEEKRYLYEIASIDIGYAFKSKEFTGSGIKLLRGQNIDPLSLKWEDTKYFPESKLDSFKHLFLKEKDIVLAMDRPIVKSGLKLARVSENDLPCVLVQRVARFKDIKVNQDFLWYALLDLNFSNYLVPNQTGSDIPHISGKQILNYELFAPDIREQNQIVIQVSKLFNYIETIEIVVQSAQKRVNLLTQSILAKAFSGELTIEWREQHQELITGINSAESLFAKIQAGREAIKPVKKAKKVK
ncbi:restriction endonuclease subunit S [Acinetobacter johnsonii]|uniref:restriction endonuclease subunit S n=1 Tax=Acinetobacter johnsonii TaxID=40214 RepID=UPI0013310D61|nr:restriction endonuclease subunit S [Acinetobacter johnsonii]